MKRRFLNNVPTTVRPLNDANKLLWERYWGPMNAAAQQLNAAFANTQNLLAGVILEREGCDPAEYQLDVDRLVILKRPK